MAENLNFISEMSLYSPQHYLNGYLSRVPHGNNDLTMRQLNTFVQSKYDEDIYGDNSSSNRPDVYKKGSSFMYRYSLDGHNQHYPTTDAIISTHL
jgi:hypothetical protein